MKRLLLEVYILDTETWSPRGKVSLPRRASRFQVEEALKPLGVLAPTGADTLDWMADGSALIYDEESLPLARLR